MRTWNRTMLVASAAVMTMALAPQQCPDTGGLSPDERVFEEIAKPLLPDAAARSRLTIHRYRYRLSPGTRVGPFSLSGTTPELKCLHTCTLYFIDFDTQAHFAHPTRIALYDRKMRTFQQVAGQWWPMVEGEPVFRTLIERSNPTTIVYPPQPSLDPVAIGPRPIMRRTVRYGVPDTPEIIRVAGFPAANTQAVLIAADEDASDTFDEDVEGMYRVLRGLGVPRNNITYLSAHHGDMAITGGHSDAKTSKTKIQEVLGQIATDPNPPQHLIFVYSSHAEVDKLACMVMTDIDHHITNTELKDWLDPIGANRITIIIEGCHSGSLKDDLEVSPGQFPNQQRVLFLSAGAGRSSYPDRDVFSGQADSNPADSGSETVWGLIEAFGTDAADTLPPFGTVDLDEAVAYAKANDVTCLPDNTGECTQGGPIVVGVNPGTRLVDPTPQNGSAKLELVEGPVIAEAMPSAAGGVGQITRCDSYEVSLKPTNPAPNATLPLGTLRVFRQQSTSNPWSPPATPPHHLRFTEIIDNLDGQLTTTFMWYIGEGETVGDTIRLAATVDFPDGSAPTQNTQAVSTAVTPTRRDGRWIVVDSSWNWLCCGCRSLR